MMSAQKGLGKSWRTPGALVCREGLGVPVGLKSSSVLL